jgi:hypothetical protein
VQESDAAAGDARPPQASILRRALFVALLFFLIANPLVLLVAAVSKNDMLHTPLARFSVFWFPVAAIFAVWVILDASTIFGFAGPRPDPFGSKSLSLSALGIANIASMLLFLILSGGG